MCDYLFANEHYPVAVFVGAFAVEDFPAAEAGNLLLDGLEFNVQLVGKGFSRQRGVVYQGVDDTLGRLAEGACLYRGTFCGYRGTFCGYRVFFFIGETPLFNQLRKLFVRDAIVDIGNDCMEGGLVGAERRLLVRCVGVELGRKGQDLPEAGAAFLHIVHLREYIGDDGVAPQGGYGVDVKILDEGAVDHSAGCDEFDAVVVDVDVEFTSNHRVLTMNEVVYKYFCNSPFGVFGEVEPVGGEFVPALGCVGFDEVLAVFQEPEEVALEFGVVDGIVFMQAAPPGADYAGLIDGAFIGEEEAGIGEEAVWCDESE